MTNYIFISGHTTYLLRQLLLLSAEKQSLSPDKTGLGMWDGIWEHLKLQLRLWRGEEYTCLTNGLVITPITFPPGRQVSYRKCSTKLPVIAFTKSPLSVYPNLQFLCLNSIKDKTTLYKMLLCHRGDSFLHFKQKDWDFYPKICDINDYKPLILK